MYWLRRARTENRPLSYDYVVFLTDATRTEFQPDPFPYTPEDTKAVYSYSKQVTKALQYLPNFTKKNAPEVHHIVQKEQFTNRNIVTRNQITDMHIHLDEAGIDRYTDPMNLMPVSAGTHHSLHTNAYIAHVHKYIMAVAPTKQGIYTALFLLRNEISAMDIFAMGY